MKKVLKVIGIIFAIFFAIGIIASIFSDDENLTTKTQDESSRDSKDKSEVVESKWKYSESSNEMDNTKTIYATLRSDNKIDFEFPYNGGSTFEFIIRKGESNCNLILRVSKGQFMSNILSDNPLRIKFDEGAAFEWNYLDANDGSMDVIFPVYSPDFLVHLKKSKTMLIEAPFAFAGRKIIRFKTANLNADF